MDENGAKAFAMTVFASVHFNEKIQINIFNSKILTQLTTGGRRDAEIATPINGPAAPSSNANATPVPDVNALLP